MREDAIVIGFMPDGRPVRRPRRECYHRGEEPQVGDVVVDQHGLFDGEARVDALVEQVGITDADVVAVVDGVRRTPQTLDLVRRGPA